MKNTLFIPEDKRPEKGEELAQKAWQIALSMEALLLEKRKKIEKTTGNGINSFLSE